MPDRDRAQLQVGRAERARAVRAAAMTAGVPRAALLAGGPFGARLSAERALAELASGMRTAGAIAPDICPLERAYERDRRGLRAALDSARFDERMRAARALVVCEWSLCRTTLSESLAFELATRARQSGVPAFAVAAESSLGPFEARILDLQAIISARGAVGLRTAGRRLAALM